MHTDHTGFHEWHKTQSAKGLFIDSKDATAQHDGTTHFTYVFRDTIQVKPNEGVLVSLLQASIPYSFYNCRAGINDKIDILYGAANATTKSAMVDFVLTLPAGNYTAISLANRIKSLLEDYMNDAHATGPNHDGATITMSSTITIVYDRDTQKFQFSIVGTGSNSGDGRIVIFNLSHGNNAGTHFDIEIGFDSDTAKKSVYFKHDGGSTQTSGDVDLATNSLDFIQTDNRTYLESTNIADLNGSVHSLYLRTNLPIISSMDSLTGGTSQIVAKLPIDVGPGSIIFHEPKNSVHKSLIQTQGIKHITLRLTDDRNRLVSLNGLHFSIALMFEFVSLKNYIVPIDSRSMSFLLSKKNNLDNKQNATRDKQTTKTSNPKRRPRKHSGPRRPKKRDSKA